MNVEKQGPDECALDAFTTAYVECALWSSTDGDATPLDDSTYGRDCLDAATLCEMIADCAAFQLEHGAELAEQDNPSRAGHDLWLTRNRHGAGFWDGDWPEAIGRRLTDAAHAYGEYTLYVGDDGMIYGSQATERTIP